MTNQHSEIDEVIKYIQLHLDESLTLDRIAKYAAYSPYHFIRIFKDKMGITPQYYISSLRLQKAKDLLLNTNLSVRDISLEIGQQSLGTFTTRFTERVGVSPAIFREQINNASHDLLSLQRLPPQHEFRPAENHLAQVSGTVHTQFDFEGIILIGLFPKPIPEGYPIYGTILSTLGDFCFTNVRPGIYYLMATTVSWGMQAKDFLLPYYTLRTRSREPIVVQPHTTIPHQQVMLFPPKLDDPPILISLPLLMRRFLNRLYVLQQK